MSLTMEFALGVLLATIVFFTGAAVASFAGLVYHRTRSLDENGSILKAISFPRSHCEVCGRTLTSLELVPIIGWLLIRGKCPTCGTHIPIKYPISEFFLGAVTLAVGMVWFPDQWTALLFIILLWALVVISAIDLAVNVIPDEMTTPLLFMGLMFSPLEPDIFFKVAGAAACWVLLHGAMAVLQTWKGREGGNGGDAAMGAVIGAWLGLHVGLICLFVFCLLYALHVVLSGKRAEGAPCGPAFSAALLLCIPYHSNIMGIYL